MITRRLFRIEWAAEMFKPRATLPYIIETMALTDEQIQRLANLEVEQRFMVEQEADNFVRFTRTQ